MSSVIELLTGVWSTYFDFLRDWEVFDNVSMLTLLITLFVISTLFPVLFTVVHKAGSARPERRAGKESSEDGD